MTEVLLGLVNSHREIRFEKTLFLLDARKTSTKRAALYNIAKQFSFLINLTLSKEEIQEDVGQLIKSINHIQNMLT